MKHSEFKKGETFYTSAGAWVVTDVGTRVVVAVRQDEHSLYPGGPPYSINEHVFDEYDIEGCSAEPL